MHYSSPARNRGYRLLFPRLQPELASEADQGQVTWISPGQSEFQRSSRGPLRRSVCTATPGVVRGKVAAWV